MTPIVLTAKSYSNPKTYKYPIFEHFERAGSAFSSRLPWVFRLKN